MTEDELPSSDSGLVFLSDLPERTRRFVAILLVHSYCVFVAFLMLKARNKLPKKLKILELTKFYVAKILHYSSNIGVFESMFRSMNRAGQYSADYDYGTSALQERGVTLFDGRNPSFPEEVADKATVLAQAYGIDISRLAKTYAEAVIPGFFANWGNHASPEDIGIRSLLDHIRAIHTPEYCLYHSAWGEEDETGRIESGVIVSPFQDFLVPWVNLKALLSELKRRAKGGLLAKRLALSLIERKRDLLTMEMGIRPFNKITENMSSFWADLPTFWVGKILRIVETHDSKYVCEVTDLSVADDASHKALVWLDRKGTFRGDMVELLEREVIMVGSISSASGTLVNKLYGVFAFPN